MIFGSNAKSPGRILPSCAHAQEGKEAGRGASVSWGNPAAIQGARLNRRGYQDLVLFNFGRTEKMWAVCGEKTHILPTAYQYFVHN